MSDDRGPDPLPTLVEALDEIYPPVSVTLKSDDSANLETLGVEEPGFELELRRDAGSPGKSILPSNPWSAVAPCPGRTSAGTPRLKG